MIEQRRRSATYPPRRSPPPETLRLCPSPAPQCGLAPGEGRDASPLHLAPRPISSSERSVPHLTASPRWRWDSWDGAHSTWESGGQQGTDPVRADREQQGRQTWASVLAHEQPVDQREEGPLSRRQLGIADLGLGVEADL